MIVYVVQMYKFGSEFANSFEGGGLIKVFSDESKCLSVFNNKDCYNWQVAFVSAFDTETGEGIDGSCYCLVNDDITPTKKGVAATIAMYQ